MSKFVYADNAATTKINKNVFNAMVPYLSEYYGNPSSIYAIGRESKKAIEVARGKVASALGANISEIFFTGSGTESDNWAIRGAAYANRQKGRHIISTKIEHHAVLHTLEALEKEGFSVTYLDVDEFGMINLDDLRNSITKETILITVMTANNEIGTIQPIMEIGEIARKNKILFHTDAVQAVGHINIDVNALNVDLLSLSAHKFNGPKGVGVLYVKKGVKLQNLLYGGGQEKGKRASTENLAGIVGLGKAIEEATKNIDENAKKVGALSNRLTEGLLKVHNSKLNGHPEKRLPNNVNISFEFVEGEGILLLLDRMGICASSGSACTSGSLDPSHVLLAIGLPHEIAHGSVRLTLSHENTNEDVDYIIATLSDIIGKLRAMSPLYEDAMKGNK